MCYYAINKVMEKDEKPQFIHLHTHSHYSLLDGLSKFENLIEIAKKSGMSAIANFTN